MTSIPLADVVAFLRPRGALGVLEGAPYFHRSVGPQWIYAHRSTDAISESHVLYLGSGDVCPAAEGWAARVLAMARSSYLPDLARLHVSNRFVRIERDGVLHEWRWDTEGESARLTSMIDPLPSTPAERLAAVLRYEMERAK